MTAAEFPKFFRVRQHFDTTVCEDIPGEVQRQLAALDLRSKVKPGQTVAITAGSRGIANIAEILKAAVAHLRHLGAEPFLVPAMGSHGGGTADGQRKVIESYGITEACCGCPIRASMETVVIGQAAEGFSVYFDRHAYEADHVLVCGRIKPHTKFTGDIQSGLMKMLMIGLGKKDGAALYHKAINEHGFPQIIRSVAPAVMKHANILAGLAIVENARDETCRLQAVPPEDFQRREPELLKLAVDSMPSLPFDDLDVLLIDEIGKNISGTGMDTNVIGRKGESVDETPRVKRVIVRDLTSETHGNAAGIGFAEFCLTRVVEKMDRPATVLNCLTACHVEGAKTPVYFDTDQQVLRAALGTLGLKSDLQTRVVWIRNTLDLMELECSEALRDEVADNPRLESASQMRPLPLDSHGMLPDDHFIAKLLTTEAH